MTARYATIVADPPWQMPSGGNYAGSGSGWEKHNRRPSALPYPTMPLDAIAALPVASLAARDAHLYLWIPNALLEHGWSVCRAWGFEPSTALVWCKPPRGIGLGGAYTHTRERVDTSWFAWKRPQNVHSRKPDAALDLVERVSPGPYLELFARRQRLGWDTWGNEAHEHVTLEGAPLAV